MTGSDIDESPLKARAGARISSDEGEEEQAEAKKGEVVHVRALPIEVARGKCARAM